MAADENGAIQQADASLGADAVRWEAVLPQAQFVNGEFYWIATITSKSGIYQKVVAVKGNDISITFEAKSVVALLEKIKNGVASNSDSSEIGDEETIVINKKTYFELLKKIEEINSLVKKIK